MDCVTCNASVDSPADVSVCEGEWSRSLCSTHTLTTSTVLRLPGMLALPLSLCTILFSQRVLIGYFCCLLLCSALTSCSSRGPTELFVAEAQRIKGVGLRTQSWFDSLWSLKDNWPLSCALIFMSSLGRTSKVYH